MAIAAFRKRGPYQWEPPIGNTFRKRTVPLSSAAIVVLRTLPCPITTWAVKRSYMRDIRRKVGIEDLRFREGTTFVELTE